MDTPETSITQDQWNTLSIGDEIRDANNRIWKVANKGDEEKHGWFIRSPFNMHNIQLFWINNTIVDMNMIRIPQLCHPLVKVLSEEEAFKESPYTAVCMKHRITYRQFLKLIDEGKIAVGMELINLDTTGHFDHISGTIVSIHPEGVEKNDTQDYIPGIMYGNDRVENGYCIYQLLVYKKGCLGFMPLLRKDAGVV